MVMSTETNIFNEFLESVDDFRIIGKHKQEIDRCIKKNFEKEGQRTI